MEQFAIEDIRNVVMLSHSGAGKTTLGEIMMFSTGAISRLGRIEEGTTTSDYEPESIKRKISLNLSMLPYAWQGVKVNLIDTPGYADFIGDVKAAIRVAEGAVIVICAASGCEVGTEQVWGYAEEAKLPRLIFINKMDRENADFNRTMDGIKTKFGMRCVPVQLPIGTHTTFKGVIDLLTMKAYNGSGKESDIPAEMQAAVKAAREKVIEAVAEIDDKLIEKYLGGEELTEGEIIGGLKQGVLECKIVPVLAGSALQNTGISLLMSAINGYLPSPAGREITVTGGALEQVLKPVKDGPLAALVFKTSADPYVGKLTYFRVFSGAINSNSQVWNAGKNAAERIGQLFMLRGKNQETVVEVAAGDIGAVAKLSQTVTGDTLCNRDKALKIPPIAFPEPNFNGAVYPRTKVDVDKVGAALARLVEEDPTLLMHRDLDTGDTILSGIGGTHLEVAVDKMQRKFGVNVDLKPPRVPYKETIKLSARGEHKHKKQSGGHGQYGHACLKVEPLPRGSGFEFADQVVGGTIPRNFIPAVEKGVQEAIHEGVLARYPLVDLKAIVYDGSYHPVDSSEICFKIAGSMALKKCVEAAQPILLEPIMELTITVPDEYTGDILSDLNTKRGQVLGMNPGGGKNIIEAKAPLAEVLRYSIDLKSMTQGRASFTMKFDHYEEVPAHITQRIIQERQAEKEAEKAA
jgi:elongation factor G